MAKINDQITILLLDTGASVTVESKNIRKCNKITSEDELRLKIANNNKITKLKMLETTMAQIETGTIVINHKIIILEDLFTLHTCNNKIRYNKKN